MFHWSADHQKMEIIFYNPLNHVDINLKPWFIIKSSKYIVPSPSTALVPKVCGLPTNTSTYFRQQGLGAISMILTSFFRGRLQALPKIWNKYRKHFKSCEFLAVWVDREVLAILTISLQEYPSYFWGEGIRLYTEGVFLCFHRQKSTKFEFLYIGVSLLNRGLVK